MSNQPRINYDHTNFKNRCKGGPRRHHQRASLKLCVTPSKSTRLFRMSGAEWSTFLARPDSWGFRSIPLFGNLSEVVMPESQPGVSDSRAAQ
jgi:hypothetical protein